MRRTSSICWHLVLIVTFALFGCGGSSGGGTTGTGGGTFSINGTLRTAANLPVAGVQVAVVGSQSSVSGVAMRIIAHARAITSDVTDEQGNFSLELDERPENLTLRFSGETFESDVEVAPVPVTATGVTLGLLYDEENESVSEESESYEEREEHEQ